MSDLFDICPACQSDDVIYRKKTNVYECENCGEVWQKAKEDDGALCQLLANDTAWMVGDMRHVPAPIAHEYQKLHDYLAQNKAVSAMLQLKDVAEILLKFNTLVMYRWLDTVMPTADLAEVRQALYAKPLSFGAWLGLARELSKWILSHFDTESQMLGVKIAGYFYQKKSEDKFLPTATYHWLDEVVAWRNDEIGHGAFRLDTEEMLGKMKPLLTGLHSAMACSPYEGFFLFLVEEGKEDVPLMGGRCLLQRHNQLSPVLNHQHSLDCYDIYLQDAEQQGEKLHLSPYVRILHCDACHLHDVFVFDGHSNKKFYFLDYLSGHRLRQAAHQQRALDIEVQRANLPTAENAKGSLDKEALSEDVLKMLEEKSLDADFIPPTYLQDALVGAMDNQKRIFWVQAAGHIGKSMFVYGLANNKTGNPQLSKNTYVVRFHIRREFRYFIHHLAESLTEQLKEIFRLKSGTRALPAFSDYQESKSGVTNKAALVRLINEYWRLGDKPDARLIVAIDGLDEIGEPKNQHEQSIFDFLPDEQTASEISEGIYYLYTSRPVVDCPPWMQEAVRDLYAVQMLTVDKTHEPYVKLLRAYFDKQLQSELKPLSQDKKDTLFSVLLQKSQSLFLYFGLLINIVKEQKLSQEQLLALPETQGLYRYYIEKLREILGENSKQFHQIKDVLCLLTACEEAYVTDSHIANEMLNHLNISAADNALNWQGISLEVLAGLLNDPHGVHSVELVFTLYSLKNLFKVERSANHARYRLGLKELETFISNYWQSEVTAWHNRLSMSFYQTWCERWQELPDDKTTQYQLRYLLAHSRLSNTAAYQQVMADDRLLEWYGGWFGGEVGRDIAGMRIIRLGLMVMFMAFPKKDLNDLRKLNWCKFLQLLARAYERSGRYDIAEQLNLSAITQIKAQLAEPQTDPASQVELLEYLADLKRYMLRLYMVCNQFSEAKALIPLHEKIYEELESLQPDGLSLKQQQAKAGNWQTLGYGYLKMNELEQAERYLTQAIELFTQLKERVSMSEDKISNLFWRSSCQQYLGETYRLRGEYDKALQQYQISIEELMEHAEPLDSNTAFLRELANTYAMQSWVYKGQKSYEEAIESLVQSLGFYEELGRLRGAELPSDWRRDWAIYSGELAEIYHKLGKTAEAEKRYLATNSLYEALYTELGEHCPVQWQKFWVDGMCSLSQLYKEMNLPEKRLDMCQQAASVLERVWDKMGDNCPIDWMRLLARSCFIAGILLYNKQDDHESLKYITKCISTLSYIEEQHKTAVKNSDARFLARGFYNKAIMVQYLGIESLDVVEACFERSFYYHTQLKDRMGERFSEAMQKEWKEAKDALLKIKEKKRQKAEQEMQ